MLAKMLAKMNTICGLILLLTVIIQKSDANVCQKLPPGLDRLVRGIDITELDVIPAEMTHTNGFNHPVIEFTCNTGRKWSNPGDPSISYDIPDQVETINSLPGGTADYKSRLYKSNEDVKKSMAANVGLGDTAGFFSLSASYQESQQTILDNLYTMAEQSAYVSAYEVQLKPYFNLKIAASVQQFIDTLPATYAQNPEKYQEFLSIFGSYFFSTGYYGGYLNAKIEITGGVSKKMNDNQIKVEAEATFLNAIKVHGGYAGTTAKVSEDFKKNTHIHEAYYGGNANLMSGGTDAYSKWWNTVIKDPWLFGGKLVPITNLLPASPKRDAISQAIVVRQDKAFIDDLLRSIDYIFKREANNNAFRLNGSSHMSYFRDTLNVEKAKLIPNHSWLESLGQQVPALIEEINKRHFAF